MKPKANLITFIRGQMDRLSQLHSDEATKAIIAEVHDYIHQNAQKYLSLSELNSIKLEKILSMRDNWSKDKTPENWDLLSDSIVDCVGGDKLLPPGTRGNFLVNGNNHSCFISNYNVMYNCTKSVIILLVRVIDDEGNVHWGDYSKFTPLK